MDGHTRYAEQRTCRKLNLGCGHDLRDGYVNVDLHEKHKPDICADVTSLPMLESSYYEEIIAQDILEHIERHKVVPTLIEWTRLLAPGGILNIRVPSLLDLLVLLAQPQNRSAAAAENIIHLIYGTQAYTGDYHLSGFTAELISDYLEGQCGLKICRAELVHGWLFDIHAQKTERLADPEAIVHSAYFHTLGRPADLGGLNHYTQALANGRLSEDQLIHQLRASEEARLIERHPRYLLGHVNLPADEPNPHHRASRFLRYFRRQPL